MKNKEDIINRIKTIVEVDVDYGIINNDNDKEKLDQFIRGFVSGCGFAGIEYGSFAEFEPKFEEIIDRGLATKDGGIK